MVSVARTAFLSSKAQCCICRLCSFCIWCVLKNEAVTKCSCIYTFLYQIVNSSIHYPTPTVSPLFFLQTQKVSSSLCYDIHYWIGSQSSQDEQGAAAVYTIQLDEFLGSTPVQHREVQNHESDAFRGYFKQGIM